MEGGDNWRDVNLTRLTLTAESVIGWTPYQSDCAAGYSDCEKLVLGNKPRLLLRPGEAMLLGVTMLSPSPPPPSLATAAAALARKSLSLRQAWRGTGMARGLE